MLSKRLAPLKSQIQNVIEESGLTYGEIQTALRQLAVEYEQKGKNFLKLSHIQLVVRNQTDGGSGEK